MGRPRVTKAGPARDEFLTLSSRLHAGSLAPSLDAVLTSELYQLGVPHAHTVMIFIPLPYPLARGKFQVSPQSAF